MINQIVWKLKLSLLDQIAPERTGAIWHDTELNRTLKKKEHLLSPKQMFLQRCIRFGCKKHSLET